MTTRNKNLNKYNVGFTLIEIMVSISIFSIVMLIVIGALIMLNDANKKAQAMRAVVDNLNFAMEDMTRSIRTGGEYKCGLSINPDGSISGAVRDCNIDDPKKGIQVIGFTGQQDKDAINTCYVYAFKKGSNEDSPGSIFFGTKRLSNSGETCNSAFSNIRPTALVSPEVEVKALRFYVIDKYSNPTNTSQQPVVIIALSGDINVNKYRFKTPFNIQTTVSKRGSEI